MGRAYTPAEDAAILFAYEEFDCDWPAIAVAFRRKEKDLKSRYRLIIDRIQTAEGGVVSAKQNAAKLRQCLTCKKRFYSTHAGNRICEPCGVANSKLNDFHGNVFIETVVM